MENMSDITPSLSELKKKLETDIKKSFCDKKSNKRNSRSLLRKMKALVSDQKNIKDLHALLDSELLHIGKK